MDSHHHDDDASDLAAAAAAALDVPQFHHELQQPDFSQHHDHDHHDPNKIEDVHIEHHIQHPHDDPHGLEIVHGLEIPDDVGHDDLNLDLGMGTPQDLDMDMGNDFRRPPTIRKGKLNDALVTRPEGVLTRSACDLCHAAKQVSQQRVDPLCTRIDL